MKLLDLLTAPWAITPEKKAEIDGIYAAHLRGEKIDIGAIEAAIGKPLQNQNVGYDVQDGIAIIELSGVMAKKMNLFTRISGGVSTQQAAEAIRTAVSDPAVTSILLVIDSPGGAVDGLPDLGSAVMDAAMQKPTAAVADGLMASAAYWVGSAAGAVFAVDAVAMVGSIGVVATHVDVSGAEAKDGYKTTEITAGKYKRIASQYAPLTESGRASIQDQVDYLYGAFLDAVMMHRGLDSRDAVHDQMADGRIFIGQQAVDAGLVDGIATVSQVFAMLGAGEIPVRSSTGARGAVSPAHAVLHARPEGGVPSSPTAHTEITMDQKDIQIAVDAALATQKAAHDAAVATAQTTAATAERARIQAVRAQSMPGHEALIETLAFDGTTTGPEAAVQVLAAEKQKTGQQLALLAADATPPAPSAAAPVTAKEEVIAAVTDESPATIKANAEKAQVYQAEQKTLGRTVSASEAYAHVTKPEGK
jgi:signal peptide peptidase SppA